MIKTVVKTFLFALAIVLLGGRSPAAAPTASEYEVKAAFLYNFIKFVEWPPKAFPQQNSPIIIGVLGDNPFYEPSKRTDYLDQTVQGKAINNRKIIVERSDRINDLKNCQLIFVTRSQRGRLREIFASLNDMSILTVGETDEFCESGGMINFFMQSDKVRFEINVGAAEKAGLKVSSKLLSVAKIVSTQAR